MAETIIVDPTEVATGRTQFDITPWVASAGPDWGDGAITAYMAQAQRGDVPVDYRVPNRTITVPLSLRNVGGTTFSTARNLIQAKAAMIQQEGGWLKRVTSGGTAVFADVVNASLHLGGGWGQAYKDYDVDATLTLECIPDFYGAEVDLGVKIAANSEWTTAIQTDLSLGAGKRIEGNYPARCRIVVTDDQPIARYGVIWALRSKNYTSSAANDIRFAASELTAIDSSIGTDWTSLYSTDRDSGTAPLGALVHQGTHRVWVRMVVPDDSIEFRLVWDVGDMTLPVINAPVVCNWASAGGAFMLDLGEVRLDAPPVGTHRWKGLIQARALVAGSTVTLHDMWVYPVEEGYGVLRAALNGEIGMAAYSARDDFDAHAAGSLAGKSAPVGGAWVSAGGGADFAVDTTNNTVTRTAISGGTAIHFDTLNTNMTATTAQVDFRAPSLPASQAVYQGVIARYVDASNSMFAYVLLRTTRLDLYVYKKVASVDTVIGYKPGVSFDTESFETIRLMVDTAGRWGVWLFRQGAKAGLPLMMGTDSVFATGGTLATGDVGIMDVAEDPPAVTRHYDNFAAWVPPSDAVIFSGQSVEIRNDGMFREDSTGAAYGPVTNVIGDLPRLPPTTIEARNCQFIVNTSRGDFDQLPDVERIDDTSVRVYYRPSWLTVPG